MRETSSRPSSLGLINKPLETSEWEGNGKEPDSRATSSSFRFLSSFINESCEQSRPGAFEVDFLQMEKERSISPCCCCCIFLLDIFVRQTFLCWRDCIQQLETDAVRFLIQVSLLSCSLSSLKASLQSLRRPWWCLTTRWVDGWVGGWGLCIRAPLIKPPL
jgi:hypothetical protein